MSPAPRTQLVDIGGVAEQLGVTVRYVRRLVAGRRIPYVKFGHYLRFDPFEIDAWIDRSRVGEIEPQGLSSIRPSRSLE